MINKHQHLTQRHQSETQNVLLVLLNRHLWLEPPRQIFSFPAPLQGKTEDTNLARNNILTTKESCEESSKLLIYPTAQQDKHLKNIRRMLNLTNHYKIL